MTCSCSRGAALLRCARVSVAGCSRCACGHFHNARACSQFTRPVCRGRRVGRFSRPNECRAVVRRVQVPLVCAPIAVSLTLPFLSDSEWLWNAAVSPAFSPKFVISIHTFRPACFSENIKQAYSSRLPRAASCNCSPPSHLRCIFAL